jgi:S1-C subfamily serine protease
MQMPVESQGVVIEDVARGSPAGRLGFEPRDIIVNINGTDIASTEVLQQIIDADASFWRVEIERNGQRIRQFIR